MREILFRGKRLDNSGWVEGYFFQNWEQTYILWGTTNGIPNMIKVDPATIGQCTELTDRNGKRVFEGDILDCGDRIVYIKWHERCGTWDSQFIRYTDKPLCSNGIAPVEWKYRAVVISNVHDNPELMKGAT